jgi:hypothetical protein
MSDLPKYNSIPGLTPHTPKTSMQEQINKKGSELRCVEVLSEAMAKILAHRPSYNHHNDSSMPYGEGITTTYARDALEACKR